MSPPPAKKCHVPDCDYTSTPGLPNYELVMRDLEMHAKYAHAAIAGAQIGTQTSNSKADRLPRPTVGEGITEADWAHFTDKWSRYKRSALSGATQQGHPLLPVKASICKEGYHQCGVLVPKTVGKVVNIACFPDTGAQLTVSGIKFIHTLGITKSELIPLSHGVSAANNSGLGLLGGAFVTFQGTGPSGAITETRQLCYVSNDAEGVYLSKAACIDLGLINKEFPVIGTFGALEANSYKDTDFNSLNKDIEMYASYSSKNDRSCKCPDRELPPPIPQTLPFPATTENREKLKQWVLDRYASSAFNQCEHQQLPLMKDSPPIQLHVDPTAKPVAIHKPRPVPIHWRDKVLSELERDVRIGVLERVPIGEPTSWCSPMVICSKPNGSPRRTVDLQALNKVAVRHTHTAEPPFMQALSVPKNKIKTVVEAWQGYHSVPLAEEDRKFTTFITPWGKFRYKTCPQGFIASGDAYNARYDSIISDFKDKTKCIDDTLLWSDDLESCFFRTCEYLTLCSNAGVIFNKKKFQFGEEEVNFLGFRIGMDSIRPCPKYLQAIREFPRTRDITGIRSWFGLIQQVVYAFSNSEVMLPFRELLKPSTEFLWNQELQDSFDQSKNWLIKEEEKGVQIYDPRKTTALCIDVFRDTR